MFDFLFKPKTPQEAVAKLQDKLKFQINDFQNDVNIVFKGKNPEMLFPETFAAMAQIRAIIEQK
jgi:cytochrome c-type biogenesis protein CcmE